MGGRLGFWVVIPSSTTKPPAPKPDMIPVLYNGNVSYRRYSLFSGLGKGEVLLTGRGLGTLWGIHSARISVLEANFVHLVAIPLLIKEVEDTTGH